MKKNALRLLLKNGLHVGRYISAHKKLPMGHEGWFNANIIIRSEGKIWYGDIDITESGGILRKIAEEIGEPLYILKEMDCRFGTENQPIDTLISKAVWSTEHEKNYEN